MIGIRITQLILDQNDVNYPLDSIQIRSNYPNRFFVTQNVVGGYANRTDLHEADGWKPYELPTYDVRTQKLGGYIEESERFTKAVIDKSQAEIDAYDQQQLDADEHAQKVDQRREDGNQYYYRVMAIVERAWQNGQVTNAIANAANTYFDDALEPILRGNWQAANVKLTVPPVTSNTPYLNVYNTVKTYVEDYVALTYSKN